MTLPDMTHTPELHQTDVPAFSWGDVPARAAMLLRDGLTPLLRSGQVQGVRADAPDAGLSRLLLTVSPGRPDLFVELFLDGEDPTPLEEQNGEENQEEMWEEMRLVALVYWVGSDEDPAVFEGDPEYPDALLAEVLDAVRRWVRER